MAKKELADSKGWKRRARKSSDEPVVLYGLAADEGREPVLFGGCAPLAHEALVRSLAGGGFSYVWFEIPLMGDARFDLHVAHSR